MPPNSRLLPLLFLLFLHALMIAAIDQATPTSHTDLVFQV